MDNFSKIISHCKEYGFIFQSSEIYDGLNSIYDYGSLGTLMKKRISELWWKSMVQFNDNIYGIDSAILMSPQIWKASGHVDNFNDLMIDNKDSNKRYRVDMLIEDYIQNKQQVNNELIQAYNTAIEKSDLDALYTIIKDYNICEPGTNSCNWTQIHHFNLMFNTKFGPNADTEIYLRPETAQGIFVNFLNIQKTNRAKIPFGIAQIGKAFRNEIVARQFIFRMREFEQMEMQFFIKPGTQKEWFEYWKDNRYNWHTKLGLTDLQFKEHTSLAHYADAAVDIEFKYPFGWKEMEGIHSRTDFDLKQHTLYSGKKLQYFDTEANFNYIPYVIETSVGLDRCLLSHISAAYTEESISDTDIRTVLKLHPLVAPVQISILPLIKKEELISIANKIKKELQLEYTVEMDSKDTIGKRYRRNDARGIPFSICVDFESITDNSITIRDRDTMNQIRVSIDSLSAYFRDIFSIKNLI